MGAWVWEPLFLSTMACVKRLCGSLCSSPLVSMETDTDLHLSPDFFSGARRQQGRQGGARREKERGMSGEDGEQWRIVSVTGVCPSVRSHHPSPLSSHHLTALQSDESSWCPTAEQAIPVASMMTPFSS